MELLRIVAFPVFLVQCGKDLGLWVVGCLILKCLLGSFTFLVLFIAIGTDSGLPDHCLTYPLICTYPKAIMDTDLCGPQVDASQKVIML